MAADVASLDAEFRHALTVHRAGDPAAAAQLYSAILEKDPRHAGAMHLLGVTHVQRGQYDEACQLIAVALRLDPSSVEARSNLASAQHERARALATARRFGAALAAYDDALALRPDHVDTLNGRATTARPGPAGCARAQAPARAWGAQVRLHAVRQGGRLTSLGLPAAAAPVIRRGLY